MFESVRRWTDDECSKERLVWLECHGIHPKCWSYGNFSLIGSKWGRMIRTENVKCNFNSLTSVRLLVRTAVHKRIDECVQVQWESGSCEVWVRELVEYEGKMGEKLAYVSSFEEDPNNCDDDQGLSNNGDRPHGNRMEEAAALEQPRIQHNYNEIHMENGVEKMALCMINNCSVGVENRQAEKEIDGGLTNSIGTPKISKNGIGENELENGNDGFMGQENIGAAATELIETYNYDCASQQHGTQRLRPYCVSNEHGDGSYDRVEIISGHREWDEVGVERERVQNVTFGGEEEVNEQSKEDENNRDKIEETTPILALQKPDATQEDIGIAVENVDVHNPLIERTPEIKTLLVKGICDILICGTDVDRRVVEDTDWFDPIANLEVNVCNSISLQRLNEKDRNNTDRNLNLGEASSKRPRGRPKRVSKNPTVGNLICPATSSMDAEIQQTWHTVKMLGVSSNDDGAVLSQLRKSKRVLNMEHNPS
ncbi:unnamed protein product [Amaranthus hypochondriacus]